MGLTVEEVMNLPIMDTSKVKTGKTSLSKRPVEWVSVIETPVENFIRKNEFVLSTGIGCGQDPDLLRQFVRDVMDSGASALAIASGRHIYDIPEDILQLADSHQFAIIDIPWEVRFGDILQDVISRLNNTLKKQQKYSEELQQKLIDLVLNGQGIPEITRYVSHKLQTPIMIIDKRGHVKGMNQIPDDFVSQFQSDYSLNQTSSLQKSKDPLYRNIESFTLHGKPLYQMKIHSLGNVLGHVIVYPNKKNFSATPEQIHVLEHLITAAALCFLKENAIEETEMRLKEDFILNLTKGILPFDEQTESRSRILGYNLDLPYVCIVGKPENMESLFKRNKSHSTSKSDWVQRLIYYILDELLHAGKAMHRQLMTTYHEELITIYLETSDDVNQEFVNHFLDQVERRLKNLFPGVEFSWGIGIHENGIKTFHTSYEKAHIALDMGYRLNRCGTRTAFKNTQMNRLLLNVANNPEMQEIISTILSPLLEYDQKRNMDLIGTFIAYNKNKDNVSQTARSLNLHRQSLLYRLRKIESLTKLSLVEPDDLFLLELSIRIWSLDVKNRQLDD